MEKKSVVYFYFSMKTWKSRNIQSCNYQEKIPYMQTFCWYLRGTLLLLELIVT